MLLIVIGSKHSYFPTSRILWINTYMPTDPQIVVEYDTTELLEILREVENIISNTRFNDIVWVGDLNWHMGRNSYFSSTMKNLVERMELVSLWTSFRLDYTHMHTDNNSVSTIDHFLVTPRFLPHVVAAGVDHRGDNMSRHSPIWMRLELGKLPKKVKGSSKALIKPSRRKATRENLEAFRSVLEQNLQVARPPPSLSCKNPC